MSLVKTEVTIKGVTGLLMHRYLWEPVEALDKRPREEQAELAAYRDEETKELYIPGVNVQRAFIGGAVFSKGKGRASLQKVVAACVQVKPEHILLGTKEYVIDTRGAVIPSTGGRIARHRPLLCDWQATFVVDWDDVLLTEPQMKRVVDDTGSRVGILDFRPECKGPFGRFIVTRWDTI